VSAEYDHVWRWRARLPERYGERCRIIVRALAMNSVGIEFERDRWRVCTSRWAVVPLADFKTPAQQEMFR
jgi:hypothetical protein